MYNNIVFNAVTLFAFSASYVAAQTATTSGGYIGYTLIPSNDPESVVYDTASTSANTSLTIPEPDVFLNASLFVGEIYLDVENITAKVNLDAQVLNLLYFNAGVDASIDRVSLLIQNVSAHVTLEARLENLVTMISDVLDSIDLNPIIATLSQDISSITNTAVSAVGGLAGSGTTSSNSISKRDLHDWQLEHNILYSINDYSGNTHTNRILSQNGTIVDQKIDNMGTVTQESEVGNFRGDMTFNGYNTTVTKNGQQVREEEYVYEPYVGLSVVSAIYIDQTGVVMGTQVLSESAGGGSSTIGNSERV
ncbi:hypothetical protein CJF32_00009737 [Rutstroemia sp. NJR-2017a WRK4]|nr:hypothetical protein CJF32_00009737 [Rutstroemia sp. NJR-2017a WRK4]